MEVNNLNPTIRIIVEDIKNVEYWDLDSLQVKINELRAFQNDSIANLLGSYYQKKSLFLQENTIENAIRWTEAVYQPLLDNRMYEYIAEMSFHIILMYYQDHKFEEASQQIKEIEPFLFNPNLKLERYGVLYGLSHRLSLRVPEQRKQEIITIVEQLKDFEWSIYHSRIKTNLVLSYYYLKDYEKARQLCDELIQKNLEQKNRFELAHLYRIQGAIREKQENDYKIYIENQYKSIAEREALGFRHLELNYRSIGHRYFRNELYNDAATAYRKAVQYGHNNNDNTSLAMDYAYLGWATFNVDNNYEKADVYYEKAIAYSYKKGVPYREVLKRKIWSLESLGRSKESQKLKLELLNIEKSTLEDRTQNRFEELKLNTILALKDKNKELELSENRVHLQDERIKRHNYVISFVVFVISLLLILIRTFMSKLNVSQLLLSSQNNLAKANQDLKESYATILEQNQRLEHSKNELSSELKSKLQLLSNNLIVMEKVQGKIEEDEDIPYKNKNKLLRLLDIESNKRIIEELDFQSDELHKDFYAKLTQKHPKLTSRNLKLSLYLKLNLSTKEIANLTFTSVESIKMARSRLRKKLELDKSISLSAYLNSIA